MSRKGSSPLDHLVSGVGRYLLGSIFILTVVAGCGGSLSVSSGGSTGGDSGRGNAGDTSGGGAPQANGLPSESYKQTPKEITFHGCPPEGDGGDPVLNQNKNRVDEGNYQPVAFSAIANLSWPKETEKKAHDQWSSSAQAEVAKSEGLPVMVEGYLADAKAEGPETPNCHSKTSDEVDFHIWLIANAGGLDARSNAVVVESTPRVRANHPGWTTSRLDAIAKAGTKVRISGWLMLDPEHPEQLGNTRGTLWEIHPIMQIEVSQGGNWVKLDDYQR